MRRPESATTQSGRVSRTVLKADAGFRAELPGFDLATLIQMTCARRERSVVRIRSYSEEGFLYCADGRIVHASAGEVIGEEAVVRILAWSDGEFSLCSRPFPPYRTIECSVEGLLRRAAQPSDDGSGGAQPSGSLQLAARPSVRGRATRPPPPPSHVQRPPVEAEPAASAALVASVRLDAHGQMIGTFGQGEGLVPLVAYVAQIAGRVGAELGLAHFDALSAELSGLQVMVFDEGGEKIGLVMRPGREARELRQRLGV